MGEEIDLTRMSEIIKKKASFVAGVSLLLAAVGLGSSFLLPRKYRSESQITIYSKYFQNPLVQELIPGQYDSSELRIQREALIRQALGDSFLDQIGSSFGIYARPEEGSDPAKKTLEREQLRKSFEIFALNGTTFQLNAIGPSAEISREMGKAALERVRATLVDQKRRTLINARDALRSRVESLSLQREASVDPLVSARPDLLAKELKKIEQELKELAPLYSDRHPRVAQLRARAALIHSWLESSPAALAQKSPPSAAASLIGDDLKAPTRDIYQELLKKYNYLEVAIDMESAGQNSYLGILKNPEIPAVAFFPNRFRFLLIGATMGALFSLFWSLMEEHLIASQPSPEKSAHAWRTNLLGILPPLGAIGDLPRSPHPPPAPGNPEALLSPNDAGTWN